MTPESLRSLLEQVQAGKLTIEEAMRRARVEPFEEIGCARVDHHRALRCGFPEVILCQGKTPAQVAEIARAILRRSPLLLATRAEPAAYRAVRKVAPRARYDAMARCITVVKEPPRRQATSVLVLCAGTADLPVAREAVVTLELFGHEPELIADVGVAGIHRLLHHSAKIQEADCIVVAAGMEGALPSVVGGLTSAPIIAVPTSIGYGASFGGVAPLLTMLNSCAAGVAVVNIDNGFGAGYLAAQIARRKGAER